MSLRPSIAAAASNGSQEAKDEAQKAVQEEIEKMRTALKKLERDTADVGTQHPEPTTGGGGAAVQMPIVDELVALFEECGVAAEGDVRGMERALR